MATNLFTGSRDEFGPTWSGHRVVRRLFCESNERAASNTQTTPKTDHISRLSADNQQLCILDKARDDENQFRAYYGPGQDPHFPLSDQPRQEEQCPRRQPPSRLELSTQCRAHTILGKKELRLLSAILSVDDFLVVSAVITAVLLENRLLLKRIRGKIQLVPPVLHNIWRSQSCSRSDERQPRVPDVLSTPSSTRTSSSGQHALSLGPAISPN